MGNNFRFPERLASMASTVQALSHGRLTLGIGAAGWYEPEYLAYGYPFLTPATRLRQLRESLQIVRALWSEEATVHSKSATSQSAGVQEPQIPFLVGGKGEQVTLRLVARSADACNMTHSTLEELERVCARIERYCEEIGRNASEIRCTIYVNCVPGRTEAEALAKIAHPSRGAAFAHIRSRGLYGTPEMIRQRLIELEDAGVQEVIISRRSVGAEEFLDLLAHCL